ncbi:MAG TPA: sugar-transfer associated ATP-grasp domain-containing protein [Bryobacteraceae bacterium]|jgi:hypothetical protein
MANLFRRPPANFWHSLPFDGQGLFSSGNSSLASLRRQSAASFWKQVPFWSRPPLIAISRLGWVAAACHRIFRHLSSEPMPPSLAIRILGDCISTGASPNEALIWRQFFNPAAPHPLPGRAASGLLSRLGNSDEHRLVADKQLTAELLAREGLPVPPLLGLLRHGEFPGPAAPLWCEPARLFVKPRIGAASRGTFSLEVTGAGTCRINNGSTVPIESLRDRLTFAATGDFLVQPYLFAAPALADLTTAGAAPVLRITTARNPREAPFLHSALLAIDVPGESPRHFIRGQLRVPIDVVTGQMRSGIWFLHPDRRYPSLPWNHAPLTGRTIPDLPAALEMALRAMDLLPGLPLVNWDLIVTPSGPVILEGNTCGNWILTNLSMIDEPGTTPLDLLLRKWAGSAR